MITFAGPAAAIKSPCALSNPASIVPQPPCSPYTITRPRIIATFTRQSFYWIYDPGTLTTLADGSAVVEEAPYALFRIHDNAARVMWAPWGSRYYDRYRALHSATYWIGSPPPRPSPSPTWARPYFYLLGSFDSTTVIQYGNDWIYGIGTDGSTDFRFSRVETDLMEEPTFFGRDPDGALWFESGSKRFRRNTVYALYLKPNRLVPLPEAVENVFQGHSGFVYATLGRNLVELRSAPNIQAHYCRGPITIEAADLYGSTDLHSAVDIAVSRMGADGSAWASTVAQVIHEHRNGKVAVIQLSKFPSTISHLLSPIALQLASDGSAWIVGYDKLVRITSDDRVEVMPFPGLGFYADLRISPDATVWVKMNNSPIVLMHIAPATE